MTAVLEHPEHTDTNSSDCGASSDSPLAYAYMRVPLDIPDDKVWRMEHELRRFTESMGLHLAGIFSEFVCGVFDAFDDMVLELQRTGARHVVVPTFRHLARNMFLQNTLLLRLEYDADAVVLELTESA